LLCSCAAPKVKPPIYEDIDVAEVFIMREHVSAIEAEFSITFYRDDSKRKGDGVLTISQYGDLSLRVYSLGFLAFELASEHGVIRSDPMLDRTKREILTYGLRDCLFWCDIKDYEIDEQEDMYLLRSFSRKLWIDSKTMLPVQQSVQLEDDRELWFYYEEPEMMGDAWYPSKIRIELSRYSLTLEFDEMLFLNEDSRGQGAKDSSEKFAIFFLRLNP
jgi:hypothetical protein